MLCRHICSCYDISLQEICRPVVCPPYYYYNTTSCESMFDTVSYKKYQVHYKVTIHSENTLCKTMFCREHLATSLEALLSRTIAENLQHCEYCNGFTEKYISVSAAVSDDTIFIFKMLFAKVLSHDLDYYLSVMTSLPQMNMSYNNASIIMIPEVISKMEFELEDSLVPLIPSMTSLSSGCTTNMELVNVISEYHCPRVQFKVEDVSVTKTEVVISSVNAKYNVNATISTGSHVFVCLDTYMNSIKGLYKEKTTPNDDLIEEILSVLSSVVSIISLICTLFVYLILKELRTIPGINNMVLSIHLIIANGLYLFGLHAAPNATLCTVIGILTHYFWLSSVMWMHICSIHMFRVFFFMENVPNTHQSKRVVYVYSLYVITVSMLLVCVNIIYSFVGESREKSSLGYGGYMCYIASSNMILFTFVIPIGCTLLSNIVLFCFVIVRIEILPEVNSAGGKNRNTFLIYIKLTCLTGVTWIFGFIYQWTLIRELSYIFIICNASQGLFIFLSFCCNARVRNMCRSRYKNTKGINKSSAISALSTKKTDCCSTRSLKC